MGTTHRARVDELLNEAAADHRRLLASLPGELAGSLPVDAQGITRAIEHIAIAAGLSPEERRSLIRPHALNPAVLHARVFGGEGLTEETVIASFVEGARVRADALTSLADSVGGAGLGHRVRELLVSAPPPVSATGAGPAARPGAVEALRATYLAQEQAAKLVAAALDAA